jgi:hypothetical protein
MSCARRKKKNEDPVREPYREGRMKNFIRENSPYIVLAIVMGGFWWVMLEIFGGIW